MKEREQQIMTALQLMEELYDMFMKRKRK